MKISSASNRRLFLRRAGILGAGLTGGLRLRAAEPKDCAGPNPPASAIPFTPDTKRSIVARPSAFALTDKQIASLAKAYAKLRELTVKSPKDPRGWLQQGDKHCWQCGGGLDGKMGEEIHGSWLFFPWHRGFLYYHERILGNLADDNDLRLPYWDWDNSAHRSVPPPYLDSKSSLHDPARSAKAGDQLPIATVAGKSFDLVGPDVIEKCMTSPDFTAFGGDASNGGNVETGPHGGVHLWCGDTTFPYGGTTGNGAPDMGLLDTAAQDPVFFSHHCNIDRLWAVWNHSDKSHTNPTDDTWKNHTFNFWDENAKWVSITLAQVLDYENNLRYTYPLPPVKPPAPATLTKLTPAAGSNAIVLPGAAVERAAVASHRTILRVEGLSAPAGGGPGIFSIIDTQTGTPLGAIIHLARSSNDTHAHGSATVTLDLSGKVKDLAKAPGGLKLAMVRIGKPQTAKPAVTPLSFRSVQLLDR